MGHPVGGEGKEKKRVIAVISSADKTELHHAERNSNPCSAWENGFENLGALFVKNGPKIAFDGRKVKERNSASFFLDASVGRIDFAEKGEGEFASIL